MALSASEVWEVRYTGNDLNGGGFKAGAAGTDYTLQDAAQKSGADLAMHASDNTKVNPAGAGVAAADVGNVIQIASGTSWTPGFYEIASQDGTYWTLDRSPSAAGNGNAATYKMGGALASLGMAGSAHVNSNTIYIKYSASVYSITSASTNISGGCLSLVEALVVGYSTTRTSVNEDTDRPTLQAAATNEYGLIQRESLGGTVRNLIFDGNSQSGSIGVNNVTAIRCKAINCTMRGFSGSVCINCEASGCSASQGVYQNCNTTSCEAHDNTYHGFVNGYHFGSLSYDNTGASVDGFSNTQLADNCVSRGNGRDGFRAEGTTMTIANSIAESNGGYGVRGYVTRPVLCVSIKNAFYNNTSGETVDMGITQGSITGTGSFFVDAANSNFALNNTAGCGAALKAAGYPATFSAGTTATYRDIGAAQHADPASGGGGPLVGPSALISA